MPTPAFCPATALFIWMGRWIVTKLGLGLRTILLHGRYTGFGSLAIEMDGRLAGSVGLVHPPHFPEPECGWFLYDGFTGQGLAIEPGRTMIDHTFASTPLKSIVSYIGVQNMASIRVPEKLGATQDPSAKTPQGEDTLVFRHLPLNTPTICTKGNQP